MEINSSEGQFTEHTINLSDNKNLFVIVGGNNSGKSTFLREVVKTIGASAYRIDVNRTVLTGEGSQNKDYLRDVVHYLIHKLCNSSSGLECALLLARDFRNLMENKLGNQLREWIERVQHSGTSEITSFANGLLRDYQSIENAISLPWSNGPVEGNVNKLKTIKRQMYGRASFELLRKRLVLKPT